MHSVGMSVETSGILAEVLPEFPQYGQENSRILPALGHDGFLPNRFQFITRSPYPSTLCSLNTESVSKDITKNIMETDCM
jgi:hypothetical protein